MVKSRTVTVTAVVPPPPKRPSSLTITVSPTSGVIPLGVRVEGSLKAGDAPYEPIPYASVRVYMNGALVGNPSTRSDGSWSLDYTIEEAGTYGIYAEFLGDATFEGCEEAENNGAWGREEEW